MSTKGTTRRLEIHGELLTPQTADKRYLKKDDETTDKEILGALVETGFVDPVTTSDGKFLTDNNGKLYIL